MRPFDCIIPRTLDEALQAMANGDARALAGGSDLIDQIRVGRRTPSMVVDIKNIPEMKRLEYREDDGLHIGAGVSCTDTAQYGPVGNHFPSIKESCLLVGSLQIQNRASIVGNVCNAAPSGDTIPSLLTYGAKALIAGPNGMREVLVEELFLGPSRTVIEPGELMVEIIVPPPPVNSTGHYLRFIPREEMDIAVVGSASMVSIDPKTKQCLKARIALASVAPTPIRAKQAERALEGQILTPSIIREASQLASNDATPIADLRGSVEYRKDLCEVLTRRTLEHCLSDLGI